MAAGLAVCFFLSACNEHIVEVPTGIEPEPVPNWEAPADKLVDRNLRDRGETWTGDEFDWGGYAGFSGADAWSGPWSEEGEADNPDRGNIQIVSDASCSDGSCLRIKGGRHATAISRGLNLEAAISARLEMATAGERLRDGFSIEVSGNGRDWTTIYLADGDARQQVSLDVSDFAAADFRIRFSSGERSSGNWFVDDLAVYYTSLLSTNQ